MNEDIKSPARQLQLFLAKKNKGCGCVGEEGMSGVRDTTDLEPFKSARAKFGNVGLSEYYVRLQEQIIIAGTCTCSGSKTRIIMSSELSRMMEMAKDVKKVLKEITHAKPKRYVYLQIRSAKGFVEDTGGGAVSNTGGCPGTSLTTWLTNLTRLTMSRQAPVLIQPMNEQQFNNSTKRATTTPSSTSTSNRKIESENATAMQDRRSNSATHSSSEIGI
ncbi:hypothetical protein V7S43_018654 [Phytophthora oleae]|uniref:Uncharacterized protein n=1 Tax=Phytophthora oleae TaxID=2107226 RepID=A0ABD3EQ21_9STRA